MGSLPQRLPISLRAKDKATSRNNMTFFSDFFSAVLNLLLKLNLTVHNSCLCVL